MTGAFWLYLPCTNICGTVLGLVGRQYYFRHRAGEDFACEGEGCRPVAGHVFLMHNIRNWH